MNAIVYKSETARCWNTLPLLTKSTYVEVIMAGRKSIRERFEEKYQVNEETGCWEWTASLKENGYGQFYFKGKCRKAHRVSYELHCGEIQAVHGYHGNCVRHKCDNKKCVNPEHLVLGTHADNMNDSKVRGLTARGYSLPQTKLDQSAVRLIKAFLDRHPPSRSGRLYGSMTFIARWFGVAPQTVSNIHSGRNWR